MYAIPSEQFIFTDGTGERALAEHIGLIGLDRTTDNWTFFQFKAKPNFKKMFNVGEAVVGK